MTLRLRDFFDNTTLTRGRDYASRGLVVSVDALNDAVLEAWVSNGGGTTYQQRIRADPRFKVDDDNVELAVEEHFGAVSHDTHGAGGPIGLWPVTDIGRVVHSKGDFCLVGHG